MNGKLRLDMLANLIEAFLRSSTTDQADSPGNRSASSEGSGDTRLQRRDSESASTPSSLIYYQAGEERTSLRTKRKNLQDEIKTAVKFSDFLASSASSPALQGSSSLILPPIQRLSLGAAELHSAGKVTQFLVQPESPPSTTTAIPASHALTAIPTPPVASLPPPAPLSTIRSPARPQRRPLVNRRASHDLDQIISQGAAVHDELVQPALDYVTVPSAERSVETTSVERVIPLIPFEELMLIEVLGTGRVSTIYRAAWMRGATERDDRSVQMVALKVAMMSSAAGDSSNVDEVRNEADIAARLQHPNVCELVGVAADPECFLLAYEFCDGGSLLSLLSDPSRYYEYLPIAMDVANGMAYLHSRNIIHRDLKPSVRSSAPALYPSSIFSS
jgi:Protein tyrosine and serine/threonine kinase